MKTFFQTYQFKQARKKQLELEAKTGLKWDCFMCHGGYGFTPIVTKETGTDPELAARLLPHLTRRGHSFVRLSEISDLSLPEVLIAAKTLVKDQQAVGGVNRMGNFASIHLCR